MENNSVRLSMFREKKHTEEREVLLKSCKELKRTKQRAKWEEQHRVENGTKNEDLVNVVNKPVENVGIKHFENIRITLFENVGIKPHEKVSDVNSNTYGG